MVDDEYLQSMVKSKQVSEKWYGAASTGSHNEVLTPFRDEYEDEKTPYLRLRHDKM